MLTLDLKPVFAARDITNPYSFLLNSGFTHPVAQNLASGAVSVVNISYL